MKFFNSLIVSILLMSSYSSLALQTTLKCDFLRAFPDEKLNDILISPPSSTPAAIPKIHVEGTLPHTGIYDISANAMRDFSYMRALGLLIRNTNNRDAVKKLSTYFEAWTSTYKPNFNPIDETLFDGFIDSYLLSKNELSSETNEAVKQFLHTMALGYLKAMDSHKTDNDDPWISNWQSHRIKLLTMISFALDDKKLYELSKFFYVRQINMNIDQNGEVLDFKKRKALYYVVYDLEPLVRAALIAQENGDDWLHLEGTKKQSLETALDWLLPYANGSKDHIDFENPTTLFDFIRKKHNIHGFNGKWSPASAVNLYWSASVLSKKYRSVALHLSTESPFWLMGLSNCY